MEDGKLPEAPASAPKTIRARKGAHSLRLASLRGLLEQLDTQTFRDLEKLGKLGVCLFFGDPATKGVRFPSPTPGHLNEVGRAYLALGEAGAKGGPEALEERDRLAQSLGLKSGKALDGIVLGLVYGDIARECKSFEGPTDERTVAQMQWALDLVTLFRDSESVYPSPEYLEKLRVLKELAELMIRMIEQAPYGIASDYAGELLMLTDTLNKQAKEIASLSRRTRIKKVAPLAESDDEDILAYWRKIASGWRGKKFFQIMDIPDDRRTEGDATIAVRQRLQQVEELLKRGEGLLDAYLAAGKLAPCLPESEARADFLQRFVDSKPLF